MTDSGDAPGAGSRVAAGIVIGEHGVTVALTGDEQHPAAQIETIGDTVHLGERTTVGDEAEREALATPVGRVDDVVAEFRSAARTVWIDGVEYDDDRIMDRYLAAVVRRIPQRPDAVSISVPATWSATATTRLRSIAEGLGLARLELVDGLDPAATAEHAFGRLPSDGVAAGTDLPSTGLSFSATRTQDRAPEIVATESAPPERRRWVAAVIVLSVVGVLAAALAVIFRDPAGTRRETPERSTTTLGDPVPGDQPQDTVSLAVGLVGAGTLAEAVGTELDRLGPGVPSALVGAPASLDATELVENLHESGASAVITDAAPPLLDGLVEEGARRGLLVCATGPRTPDPAEAFFLGTVGRCSELLGLAFVSGSTSSPSVIRREAFALVTDQGVECSGFPQCSNLLNGGQVVSYRPPENELEIVRSRS